MKIRKLNLGDPGSLARKLVLEALGSTGLRLLGTAVAFLVGVQLARYMGPTEYGRYGTVMALATLLVTAAQLGLPQLATRDVSVFVSQGALNEAKGVLVWLSAAVLAASALFAVAGVVGYMAWTRELTDPLASAYYWGFGSIPLLALTALFAGMLRGYQQVVGAQFFDVLLRPAIFAILLFVAASLSFRLDAAVTMAIQTAAAAMTLGLCFWSLWKLTPPQIRGAKAVARWRAWAAFAAPQTGTEFVRILDSQYAILIFGALASLHDTGVFRVALAISVFVGLPSSVISLVIMPHVAELHSSGDQRKLQLIATNSSLALFASGLLATLALALVGEPAITLAFGNAYRDSWLPLVVMAGGYTIGSFFGSCTVLLIMTGCERAVTVAYVAGLAVGVGVTFGLYGVFGTTAAAIAVGASGLVRGAMMWRVARDRLAVDTSAASAIYGLNRWRFLWRPRTV